MRTTNLLESERTADAPGGRSGAAARLKGLPFAVGAITLALVGVGSAGQARAADAASLLGGNLGAQDKANGPIVSIISPNYNDLLAGEVQVLVGVQARKHTPQSIELYVDGKLHSDPRMPLSAFPANQFTWKTARFSDGPHNLRVVITDTQGFRGSAEVTVFINNNRVKDLTPPALEWINVRQGDVWRGLVDLHLKAVDNFGVKFLIISLKPVQPTGQKPDSWSWLLNRPPYSIKGWDSRRLPDGMYSLRAIGYDALENEGPAAPLSIIIGNRSINPTWKLPDAPLNSSNRANPTVSDALPRPGAPDSTSGTVEEGAGDANDAMVLDNTSTPSAAAGASAPQSASAKRTPPARRVAATRSREVGPPALSAPRAATGDGVAASPASRDGNWVGAHSLRAADRLAVVSAPPRLLRNATRESTLSRPDMMPRDGVSASPRVGEAAASQAPRAPRTSAPPAIERALPGARPAAKVAGSQVERRGNPVLASAPMARATADAALTISRSTAGSRVAAATPGTSVVETPERILSPLPPSSLPSVTRPTAPARSAALTGAAERSVAPVAGVATVAPQGSVAAPSFPRVDLTRRPAAAAPRDSAPNLVAAMPPVLRPMSEAAITVAAMPSALPRLHRALRGETMASVASRYGLPANVLAMHNNVPARSALKAGQDLKLPQTLAVSLRGQKVEGDVDSMMVAGVGVTPFRFLFEKQGGQLKWDAKNARVTAQNGAHQVTLAIGSRSALVNKKEVMMDLAAFLVSGRTMVPLRFFEKALNASVEWEPATGRLLVAMAQ